MNQPRLQTKPIRFHSGITFEKVTISYYNFYYSVIYNHYKSAAFGQENDS
jgi:hypothetical protein